MLELAWGNIIKSLRNPRVEKPRKTGCTMVMDVWFWHLCLHGQSLVAGKTTIAGGA